MTRLNLSSRRLHVSADLPDPWALRLHRLRHRAGRAGAPHPGAPSGGLTFAKRVPELSLAHRDAQEAVEFYRRFGTAVGVPARSDSELPDDLAEAVGRVVWYHTIELPGGVVTPGLYDHRELVPRYGLPPDLGGQRTLDVATFDGFWAFEMERRGAEVVATDLDRFSACDFPPPVRQALVAGGLDRDTGIGFRLAHRALRSKVTRVSRSIYDLDPSHDGLFDLVHVADLLLHLERPLDALRAVRSVTGGQAIITDCFEPGLAPGTVRYGGAWANVPWWVPSLEALGQMVIDAGFREVELTSVYALASRGEARGHWRASFRATP